MNKSEINTDSGLELLALLHHTLKHMARAHHCSGRSRHAQRRALSVLAARSPLGQRELLEELDVRSASLSEVLAKLERHGLIGRERDKDDRRNFIIHITDEGRAELEKHGDEPISGAETVFSKFSAEERARLAELLRKLNESLDEFNSLHGHGHDHGPGHNRHAHACRGHGECHGDFHDELSGECSRPRGRRSGRSCRGHSR